MHDQSVARRTFVQAVVIGGVTLLFLLVLYAAQVLLLVFAGILVGVLLYGIACWITRKTGLHHYVALALAVLVPLGLLVLGGWLIAPAVAEQASQLAERLPQAAQQLKRQLLQYDLVQRIWQSTDHLSQYLPQSAKQMQYLRNFFTTAFGAIGSLIFALFVGLFLAINPSMYIDNAVRLMPPARRERTREVLCKTGRTLRNWLIGKIIAMAVIGVLTTAGLWMLGIDLALVLGVIAAILSFVPNFGPIIALIPAVLIALISGTDKALYVVLLYTAIQTVESYMLTPALQLHMVNMPPALLLTVQVLMATLVGVLGLILATPLAAAVIVIVSMAYVHDMLERGTRGEAR